MKPNTELSSTVTRPSRPSVARKAKARGTPAKLEATPEKVIVAEPDHGLAIGWGVSALVALHEVDRAKEWTSRALLLDPDNTNLIFNLACNMVLLGELDKAIELLAPVFARVQRQNLLWFAADTTLDPIRDHPRYKA